MTSLPRFRAGAFVPFVPGRERLSRIRGRCSSLEVVNRGDRRLHLAGLALASGCLTLVVASCTSDPAPAPIAATADASAGDAETDGAASGDAEAGPGCPGSTPATYPWQSPAPVDASACSEADLQKLAAAVAAKSISSERDIANALGARCSACAVGRVSDDAWRAIVGGHLGYIGNVGGCVVRLGASDVCGRMTDALSTCLIVGCSGCKTRKEEDACADVLTGVDGACAGYLKSMRAECSARIVSAAFSSTGPCQSFVETVRLFCGPAPADAGTD